MYRNGDIVSKCMVVQGVDTEEQHNIDPPTFQRDFVWSNKERWACFVELRDITRDGDEDELDERQEGTASRLDAVMESLS